MSKLTVKTLTCITQSESSPDDIYIEFSKDGAELAKVWPENEDSSPVQEGDVITLNFEFEYSNKATLRVMELDPLSPDDLIGELIVNNSQWGETVLTMTGDGAEYQLSYAVEM